MILMQSKYKGKCPRCSGVINVGDDIAAYPEMRQAFHLKCSKTAAALEQQQQQQQQQQCAELLEDRLNKNLIQDNACLRERLKVLEKILEDMSDEFERLTVECAGCNRRIGNGHNFCPVCGSDPDDFGV